MVPSFKILEDNSSSELNTCDIQAPEDLSKKEQSKVNTFAGTFAMIRICK